MDNVSVSLVIWVTDVNQVCADHFLFTNHWNVVSASCAHDPSYYSKLSIYPPDVHTKAWMCSSREFWKPLDFRLLVALVLSQSMELLAHLLCKDDFLLGYHNLIAIYTSSEYLNIIDVCMWWAHANIACLHHSRWVFQFQNWEDFQVFSRNHFTKNPRKIGV